MGHNPTEHVQEEIEHTAAHGAGPKWVTWAALTAAFLAALAAIASAQATTHLTESTRKRIEANDQWNFFQSKSIKGSIIDTRMMTYAMADATGKEAAKKQHDDDVKKRAEYDTPLDKDNPEKPQGTKGIQVKAEKLEELSSAHLHTHETFEKAATMFHISIAIVAIAVVAKRKEFWFFSMLGGVAGILYFSSAFMHAPAAEGHGAAEHGAAPAAQHAASAGPAAPAASHEAKPEGH